MVRTRPPTTDLQIFRPTHQPPQHCPTSPQAHDSILPLFLSGLGLRVNDSEEFKLRQELFANKDVMVRPVKSYSDVVNVSFSLIVRSLSDLVCV